MAFCSFTLCQSCYHLWPYNTTFNDNISSRFLAQRSWTSGWFRCCHHKSVETTSLCSSSFRVSVRKCSRFSKTPEIEMEALLKRYYTKVQYFVGSVMNVADLHRIQVERFLDSTRISIENWTLFICTGWQSCCMFNNCW